MTDDEIDAAINDGNIDDLFAEKTGRSIEDLMDIGEMLINFTLPIKSELTGQMYQGFVDVSQNKFIVKQEFTQK